jgi:mRNA (guanine-N7-)-methyltransferase
MSQDELSEDEDKQQAFFNLSSQQNKNDDSPKPNEDQKQEEDLKSQDENKNSFLQKKHKPDQVVEKAFVSCKDYYTTNGVRDPGKEGRKASRIIFLRSFNNWVKACMINKYCRQLGKDLSILELCCGKGGDLDKYLINKIKLFVGADISGELLENAMARLEKIKNEKYSNCFRTKCYFIKEDLSSPENRFLEKIDKKYYFDLVSCQFALHYHFENEQRLNAFLINVSSRLCKGGYFIGTIIEDNVIVKRLRNRKNIHDNKYINEKLTFGNEFYSVKFFQKHFNKKNGPYGIKYGFYLEDSIDNRDEKGNIKYVGEYLVVFKEFVEICKKYGLYLVEKKNFTKFYQDYIKDDFYKKLSNKMLKDINTSNMNQQWEIIQLYMVFVFRKGKETNNNNKTKYRPYLEKNNIILDNFEPEFHEETFD